MRGNAQLDSRPRSTSYPKEQPILGVGAPSMFGMDVL